VLPGNNAVVAHQNIPGHGLLSDVSECHH
jgi:hypothetical protein